IKPVISRVLRNQIQFLHAIRHKLTRFLDDIALLPAAMAAAHSRDDAETAWMIAAFSNLHICEMLRGQPKPWRAEIRNVLRPEIDRNQRPCGFPIQIDLSGGSGFLVVVVIDAGIQFRKPSSDRGSARSLFG